MRFLIVVGAMLALTSSPALAAPRQGGRLTSPHRSAVRRSRALYRREVRAVDGFARSENGTVQACRHVGRRGRGVECQVSVPVTTSLTASVLHAVARIRAWPTVWMCAPWHGVQMRRVGSWTYTAPPGDEFASPTYAGPAS